MLRLHAGSVNAVTFLADGGIATGGQDGAIGIWGSGDDYPARVIAAHAGPIAALATDGRRLAAAGWDGVARLIDLNGGPETTLDAGAGPLNGIGFLPDGGVVTAGYDGALRFWDPAGAPGPVIRSATPLNALAVAPDGGVWTAGSDGVLRLFGPAADAQSEIPVGSAPLVALALGGGRLAAGGLDGRVTLVGVADQRVTRSIDASAGPVWSVALAGDVVLAGGSDSVVRAWDAASGAALASTAEALPDERAGTGRGAQVFRACAACHSLGPGDEARAGPSLHGLFGRRIATAAGYDFSPALRRLDIVWTPETVAELFDVGPNRYTPGTKMPEQRIANSADRSALIEFLEAETR